MEIEHVEYSKEVLDADRYMATGVAKLSFQMGANRAIKALLSRLDVSTVSGEVMAVIQEVSKEVLELS